MVYLTKSPEDQYENAKARLIFARGFLETIRNSAEIMSPETFTTIYAGTPEFDDYLAGCERSVLKAEAELNLLDTGKPNP